MSQILADIDHGTGSAAVLFMDLYRFKQVNDTMGHMVGDQLLVEVAVRLKRSLCEDDLVVRLGGDEFVILQDSTSRRHAELVACG
jgi:diguanylate cyclase (GGDEF)-like protein